MTDTATQPTQTARTADRYALVADIGGTNTRVGLCEGKHLLPKSIRRFSNAEFDGLGPILRAYIKTEGGVDCAGACVAAAGPVRDGVATMTNLNWTIDRETLISATRAETVSILNDLQAQGHALGHLDATNLLQISPGKPASQNAVKMVVGVGTGFNCAPVYDTADGRFVAPSECGHINLPIRTDQDLSLSRFVEAAHGFPAVEDVVSGRGLERVYHWQSIENNSENTLSAAEIMTAAAQGNDPIATKTVAVFSRMLGSVAGNLALVNLPFGGVYLVGGVSRAFAPYLGSNGFIEGFRDKGRFAPFMDSFSVTVIEDDYAALIGMAHHLFYLTQKK